MFLVLKNLKIVRVKMNPKDNKIKCGHLKNAGSVSRRTHTRAAQIEVVILPDTLTEPLSVSASFCLHMKLLMRGSRAVRRDNG